MARGVTGVGAGLDIFGDEAYDINGSDGQEKDKTGTCRQIIVTVRRRLDVLDAKTAVAEIPWTISERDGKDVEAI